MASVSSSPFRPDCLQGQTALITGGGSGIGLEISRQLSFHGCQVVICGRRSRDQVRLPTTVSHYLVCDVRDHQQCSKVIEYIQKNIGRLDILVNAAAGNFLAAAKDLSPRGFATVMAIDVNGTFHMCKAAFPLLNQNGGVIVNISATLQYGATYWQAHAAAAKSAVDSLTRSLALEWGPNIRVVGVAPGPIADTPGVQKLAPQNDQVQQLVQQGIPLQRMGQAQEIAQAVIFLCTAQYVTGHTLVVDGGQWLYRPPLVAADKVAQLSRQVETASRAHAKQNARL